MNLSNCGKLTVVSARICSNLSSLDLTGCNDLWCLYLSGCTSLTSLDLRSFSKLFYVQISNSGISSLKVSGTNIEYLYCSGCELTSLDLSGMDDLTELNVVVNKIRSLDISGAPLIANIYQNGDKRQDSINCEYSLDNHLFVFDHNVTIKGVFAAPSQVNTSDITGSSVKLSWNSVTDATGYEVWRSKDRDSGYVCIYQGTATSKVSSSLTADTTYYYKVRAYKVVDSKKVYTPYTSVVSVVTMPVPKIENITVLSGSRLKLTWTPVSGASGYEVRTYIEDDSDYQEPVTSVTGTSCIVAPRDGVYYCGYTVCAYKMVDGVKIYGGESSFIRLVKNDVPADVRLTSVGRNSITVRWSPADETSGMYTYYEVWRSKSPTSGFVCLGRYSGASKVSTNLTPNTTYYYKVRAYSYVYDDNGVIHRYYTGYSNVVSATTKK